MKTTLLLPAALLLFAGISTASAQSASHQHATRAESTRTVTPPDSVVSAFQNKYSGMTPNWQITPSGNYCAAVDNNGQKAYAEFGPDGKWIRTRTDVTPDQMSEPARKAIQNQYPAMGIASVQKLEYENVNPFYRVDLKQGDQTKSIMVNDAGYVQE